MKRSIQLMHSALHVAMLVICTSITLTNTLSSQPTPRFAARMMALPAESSEQATPALTRWEQLKARASEFAASTKTKAEEAVQAATRKIMALGEKMGISKKRVAALIIGAAIASGGIYASEELRKKIKLDRDLKALYEMELNPDENL